MKKSFWGYNTQEVQEAIELLEIQNSRLEKQVKQLTAELETVRLERDKAIAEKGGNTAATKELEELKARCETLEKENRRLTEDKESAVRHAQELRVQQDELGQVSDICRSAYADMAEAKRGVREKIDAFAESFLNQWAACAEEMSQISAELQQVQEASRDAFLSAADDILGKYAFLSEKSRDIQGQLEDMDTAEKDISSQVNRLLSSLDEERASEPEEDKGIAEEEESYAVLRALRERERGTQNAVESGVVSTERDTIPDAPLELPNIGIAVGVNPRSVVNK